MPGPRSGLANVGIVSVKVDGVDFDMAAPDVPSTILHRHCQNGEACNGPGCKLHTGKTEGRTRALGPNEIKLLRAQAAMRNATLAGGGF